MARETPVMRLVVSIQREICEITGLIDRVAADGGTSPAMQSYRRGLMAALILAQQALADEQAVERRRVA